MGILDEDIQRVRESTDIVALISEHLALKRVGSRWTGLCPFHAERSPSFSVNAEEGLYYCFGCSAGGDSISFIMEMDHLDFVDAVERLGARSGIEIRYDRKGQGEGRSNKTKLYEVMEQAVAWYHEQLLSAPDAAEARAYLRGRGIDGEIVRQFRLGFAPNDWDALVTDLDVPFDTLEKLNLGMINRRNKRQDAFRNRIMFPVFDAQGNPVAFSGRIMPDGQGPKYRNSSETPIYAKSKVLYGLNWAKGEIVRADEAIICEGAIDVIGMFQAGMPRAVAPCGTALTEDHVKLLTRFAKKITLAFDNDGAGGKAAAKFYQWEAKYGADVRVVALPEGQDPAELAQTAPEALQGAVKAAQPFLGFRFERALADVDLSSPEGKVRGADMALPVIAEHPDEMVRDQYIMTLADRVHLDPARLRRRLKEAARTEGEEDEPELVAEAPDVTGREMQALKMMVHRRGIMVDYIDGDLFVSPVAAEAYYALLEAPTIQDALVGADEEVTQLLHRLVQEEEGDTAPEDVAALLLRDALDRRKTEARRADDFAVVHEINRLTDRVQIPCDGDVLREALGFLAREPAILEA